jgi:putative ABC transport system permease protein
MDEELRIHREMAEENLRRRGAPSWEARHAASRVLGNVTLALEDSRAQWNFMWLEALFQDLRYALRTLRKSPGFTAIALLTLALGIGANTAIFSVVYGVLLRPLPYKDASRLIVLNETTPRVGSVSVSYPNFLDWRAQSRTFSEIAAVGQVGFNLAGITQPESIQGEAVSPNFLSMLGVRPLIGRDFNASEEKAGTAPVVLLSYQLWQSHFGGEHSAIGRTIRLDGNAVTIIGVLPPEFRSLDKTDVLEPIGVSAGNNSSALL